MNTTPKDTTPIITVFNSPDVMGTIKAYMYPGKSTKCYESWNGDGDTAASYGYLPLMRERNLEYTFMAPIYAAEKGHLDTLKFLREVKNMNVSIHAMVMAAGNGHFDVVKYLVLPGKLESDCAFDDLTTKGLLRDAVGAAAASGNLEIMKFLWDEGSICTVDGAMKAGSGGHLDVIKFLHKNQPTILSQLVIDASAQSGQMKIVEFLYTVTKERCSFSSIDYAAGNGHLEMVRFFHEIKEYGSGWGFFWAASNGHLEVLKILLQDAELEDMKSSLEWATQRGHTDVAEWLAVKIGDLP